MRRKIISPLIAAAMLTAGATNAYAADNPFDGYAVTVYDQTAPCVFAAGKDWPITNWYFFNSAVMEIAKADRSGNVNWEFWLADAFNDYRRLDETADPAPTTEDWAWEVIELTNAEREKHGLYPLEVDEELMELAQIRAKEVSTKYSHERPDGTRVSKTHGCGENVGAKKSVEKQVTSWMNSDGHRANILLERYQSIGVGCYQAENGRFYWVQIFRP